MHTLEDYRREVDAIDRDLVATLSRRMRLCEEFKRRNDIPMMQHGRVAAVLANGARLANQHGIAPLLVTRIYELIIEESCRVETVIIDGADPSDEAAEPTDGRSR
jgi:4-amino-4-deoxychorismate mutase